jgi:molybdenum cofactor cytidylyltransferase
VPENASGAIVLLGDMPLVSAHLINHLAQSFEAAARADAIVPLTQDRRGNPVLLARSLFPAVSRLSGDEGARILLQSPDISVVEVPVEGKGASADIDTPETLQDWQGRVLEA